jgi:hypothetical protein
MGSPMTSQVRGSSFPKSAKYSSLFERALSVSVLAPSSFAKSMPLTKRTVFVSTESLFSGGTVERGGRRNVSSHVGSTRFGGGGTRGEARAEPFDGVGETDVRFDPLTSSSFAFGFGDGEGERGGPGTGLDGRISRVAGSFPARVSEFTARERVLPRSSTPSSISITSILSSSRSSVSVIRLASSDLELKNEAQPDILAVIEDSMGFVGSTCAVEVGSCRVSASAVFGVTVPGSTWLALSSSGWILSGADAKVD